ncbi:MAG: ATP-binding protein [Acidobacteriota bacterium]
MTLPTPPRLIGRTLVATLILAALGVLWTTVRYGASEDAMLRRVERDVRTTIGVRSTHVASLARSAAAEAELIDEAVRSRARLADLFARLEALSAGATSEPIAVTVFVPGRPPAASHRVLAWSDGPGEQTLAEERLAGPAALFTAPGHAGLRLVAVEPVLHDGRRIGVAVAETVLAGVGRQLETALGPVTLVEQYARTDGPGDERAFLVHAPAGTPLVEARVDMDQLRAHRTAFLRRVLAGALVPLPLALSLLALLATARSGRLYLRTPEGRRIRARATLRFVVLTTAAALGYAALTQLGGLPVTAALAVLAIGGLAILTRVAAWLWWRVEAARRPETKRTVRFVVEQLAGGLILAGALELIARLLERWITLPVLDRGPFVLFPVSPSHTLSVGLILLVETAVAWAAGTALALLAIRWRVPGTLRATGALVCWIAPVGLLYALHGSVARLAGPTLVLVAAALAGGTLLAATYRHRCRRATQSARLFLALLAGLAPLLALYPLAAVTATRTTREIVATSYAPAAAGHPQELLAELSRAQTRIDALPGLEQLVNSPPGDSQPAYFVWSHTGLERSRVISDVELYGPDRTLVSRFAFNLPEYVYRTTLQPWQGTSCTWEVFGEVTPFGAEERTMLHAERGVCDADGRLLGGVVVHVAGSDYQALPFIASPSPYVDAIGGPDAGPRLQGVRLVVYGWSFAPVYASEGASWAVPQHVLERLYETGEPFWIRLEADHATYDVHLSQNRAGIYAIGVPRLPLVEHLTRVAEIAVLVAVFFVAWQAALLLQAALVRQPHPPLRQLLREVRTSFYRKLFLSFVVVAVLPVVVAAVAFGGYMTTRFRADVEYEAATTVNVARRVFEELTASAERALNGPAEPSDDVMVWIRQVIGQDVNLFVGPELALTSQGDLFDSGVLPMRTPAAVYRAIALERRPSFVAEDRIGSYSYVVAAAPVPDLGPDALITVPLAPRQREMERERDTLNRRMLVGAVLVVLLAAGIGASLAGRIADPVARLTRATRQIAAGRLDVRVSTDTADELRRLVDDFNSMAATLGAQRDELARTHQLKAWNEMARQVAHEIKNPLTPIQLAAEHLQQVHTDRGRPLGDVLDRCIGTVLTQVRLLRQIASEFSNFASEPTSRPTRLDLGPLVDDVVAPYRVGVHAAIEYDVQVPADLPPIHADRTLVSRALTNLIENAVQAMPNGGRLTISGRLDEGQLVLDIVDTGVGMDAEALEHAFEPFFSTKTGGSGLGLANARRNIERQGGTVSITSAPGAGTTVRVTFPAAPPDSAAPS